MALLNLPIDVLRYHIFNPENMEEIDLFICSVVCRKLRTLIKKDVKFYIFVAAGKGYLEILKWVRSEGCPWHILTCAGAAYYGQLEVLKWCRLNGCPWNYQACSESAAGGHLEILKWWHFNGCEWNKETCESAARYGHLEVLKWARENDCEWSFDTCRNAARNGHLEVLKWLEDNCCPPFSNIREIDYLTVHIFEEAAGGGHLQILIWLKSVGCHWNERACSVAADAGHLHVLKWLRENGCPPFTPNLGINDEEDCICSSAAISGQVEVIKWARYDSPEARSVGCRWNSSTCENGVLYNHLELLKWLIENGCPWNKTECIQYAKERGYTEMVQWINLQE